MPDVISFEKVSKTYPNGVRALSRVSFSARKGERIALLGPNGAGKTTTIKILTGLLRSDEGTVTVSGRIGLALQEIGLWPHLTVNETLRFVSSLYHAGPRSGSGIGADGAVTGLLGALGLADHRGKRFEELSHGLKRRLNLACALVHHPDILILDEPSLGLDVHGRLSFWDCLEDWITRHEMTLFLSTHDMDEAERFNDRVAILDNGQLLDIGTFQELRQTHGRGDEISFKTGKGEILFEAISRIPGIISAERHNERFKLLAVRGTERLPSIILSLEKAGVKMDDLRVSPCTLEQIFLNVSGHALG